MHLPNMGLMGLAATTAKFEILAYVISIAYWR